MAQDPYNVLGVTHDATEDEIRRAYRRLAKELHPDMNPGQQAADAFKQVSAAYGLLGDSGKRRAFDNGEIDASGEKRGFQDAYGQGGFAAGGASAGGGGDDFGFGDIFTDLFGARSGAGRRSSPSGSGYSMRGRDVRYTLEVEFNESITGAKKRVTLPEGGTLDLSVPPGVTNGQTLRLKGKGTPGIRGGAHGDALIEITVRPHPDFKREGKDILFDLPISIDEAVLGAKIKVPTVDGHVQITIPKATSSGRILRLKGKGVNSKASGKAGDQLVTIRIVLPKEVDDELAYFMSEWRLKNGYDAGRKD